jgi:hypothetical protein
MLNRAILSQGGGLTELPNLTDLESQTTSLTLDTGDYIYVCSPTRYNSQYLKLSTPSGADANLTVEYWGGAGESWVSVVDKVDQSSGLQGSGLLQFTLNRDKSWAIDDTENIPELALKTVYGQYWLRIGVQNSATVDLDFLGALFVESDDNLTIEYPLLADADFKAGWEVTDWEKQRIKASELVLLDLIGSQHLQAPGQLLSYYQMRALTVPYTAYLIFSGTQGEYYRQAAQDALNVYQARRQKSTLVVDTNGNGRVDQAEQVRRNEVILRR